MVSVPPANWKSLCVPPAEVMKKIEPGVSIFIGTGVSEPRTLVKHLMSAGSDRVLDLELIQILSLGDAICLPAIRSNRFRLKTFFSGWVASEAITAGQVDLIPAGFQQIPKLIETGQIPVDVAFVQVTPPNESGFCSFGASVDVAREAMEKADLVVGEINPQAPLTYGDTFVSIDEFDMLVQSENDLIYFPRWPVDDVFDKVAANVSSVIEDGSCIAFSIGPLFESLGRHLAQKKQLGVHSPFMTDALMDLIRSGAVSNRKKGIFRGKSLAAYAFGSPELMRWLDRNPLVEFQGVENVFDPIQIARNPRFVSVLPARKVDLSGQIALHTGKGNVAATPAEAMNFFFGAGMSAGGLTIFALPSRNLQGKPNILLSVEDFPNQFSMKESIDMIVTEYGVANLPGRSVRERAQALIEIAHPDDRKNLVEEAKEKRILYPDQIFLEESAHLYPAEVKAKHTFRNDTPVRFRAIRPSDEEEMRRLFYRFSDQSVYYRYFSPIKTMPHAKMQEYVNINYEQAMSIVGIVGDVGQGHIIAEGRFVREKSRPWADVAFVVDETYQGLGIATFLYTMLIRLARDRGIQGFTADVLASNKGMMKVFERGGLTVNAKLESGCYHLEIAFDEKNPGGERKNKPS